MASKRPREAMDKPNNNNNNNNNSDDEDIITEHIILRLPAAFSDPHHHPAPRQTPSAQQQQQTPMNSNNNNNIKFSDVTIFKTLGLDTSQPFVQIGTTFYYGKYEATTGAAGTLVATNTQTGVPVASNEIHTLTLKRIVVDRRTK
eukprot:PhM_4_TR4236/c0_g1_i3/m.60837